MLDSEVGVFGLEGFGAQYGSTDDNLILPRLNSNFPMRKRLIHDSEVLSLDAIPVVCYAHPNTSFEVSYHDGDATL